jgi:predicted RNA binding protein with dsRBD fold (UPF0201 family)
MEEITVHIEAEVNPTESEDKVKKAIENIFGPLQSKLQTVHKGGVLTAEISTREPLIKLQNLLRRERIRAAARIALLEGADTKTLTFYLNKQVAFAGHLSFAKETAESPLGPIKVKITCENPKEIVNWLTSETM